MHNVKQWARALGVCVYDQRPRASGFANCTVIYLLVRIPSEEGGQRCAHAQLVNGQETTSRRKVHSLASASFAVHEAIGQGLGIFCGPRT